MSSRYLCHFETVLWILYWGDLAVKMGRFLGEIYGWLHAAFLGLLIWFWLPGTISFLVLLPAFFSSWSLEPTRKSRICCKYSKSLIIPVLAYFLWAESLSSNSYCQQSLSKVQSLQVADDLSSVDWRWIRAHQIWKAVIIWIFGNGPSHLLQHSVAKLNPYPEDKTEGTWVSMTTPHLAIALKKSSLDSMPLSWRSKNLIFLKRKASILVLEEALKVIFWMSSASKLNSWCWYAGMD